MGNVFEAEEKKADSLGKGKKDTDKPSYYINEEERVHLQVTFQKVVSSDHHLIAEEFKALVLQFSNVFLVESLCSFLENSGVLKNYASFERFITESARVSASSTLQILWNMSNHLPISKVPEWDNHALRFCALLLILSSGISEADERKLFSLSKELLAFYTLSAHRSELDSPIDEDFLALQGVINNYSAHAAKPFQSLVAIAFLNALDSPSFKPYLAPELLEGSDILAGVEAGFLAMTGEELQGRWKQLYTMTKDGISFNRIVHHVLGYNGPTVILIRTAQESNVLGFYCHDRWRESNRFYGSSSNFIFTLDPHLRIYRAKNPSNMNFQFLATSGFNTPHGLGLGGTLDGFRLFIPDTLENCVARSICPTYEPGKMIFTDRMNVIENSHGMQNAATVFEIAHMEVWGSGGALRVEHGLLAQKETRVAMYANIEKARKVDKAQFFNNGFDREFLLSKTFSHQKDMQERLEEEYKTTT